MKHLGSFRHALAHWLLVPAIAVASGCSSDDDAAQEPVLWNTDSAALEFTLRGAFGGRICELSLTREALTEEQLDGLYSLMLREGEQGGGCDYESYAIVVHAKDGSTSQFDAVYEQCAFTTFVPFEDFDEWARSTSCSTASHD